MKNPIENREMLENVSFRANSCSLKASAMFFKVR